ncbi:unnamed protein product [Bemisia tabaci]|uniref:Enoyl reductase (ER) domain-containing protein n=1 Tax=Bemisia tabaci TaxID=7038 RepID=A0A9P0AMF4_BEMTA|nr:unnamed protein product [Bemisia tabaci]
MDQHLGAAREWGEESAKFAGAEYFTNNLLSSVLFEEAFAEVPADAVILEVAPQSLLLPILKRAFPTSVTSLSLTGRISEEKPAFVHFLGSVGELYLLGYEPNPAGLYPPISYPVAASTPDLASFVTWEHSFRFDAKKFLLVPDEFDLVSEPQEKSMDMIIMQLKEFRHLFEGHVLVSRPMIPVSYFLKEIWLLLAPKGRFKKDFDEITPHFTDILVHSLIWMDDLPEEASLVIQLSPASGSFEVCLAYRGEKTLPLKGDVIVSGKAVIYEKDFEKERWCCEHPPTSCIRRTLNIQDLKNAYGAKGYDLSPEFQNNISELQIYDEVSVGKLTWKKNWQSVIDGVIKAGLLINVDDTEVSCPVAIQSLIIKPDDIKLMDYGSDITFALDRRQNVLVAAEGIEMKGVIFKAPPKRVSVAQTLECSKFLPYFTSNFQQVEEFLSAALDIMLDCCPSHKKETHKINICECGSLSRETGILSDLKRTVHNHYSSEISLTFNDEAATKHDFRGLNLLVTSENGLKAGFIQQAEDLMSDFILCIAENFKSLPVPGFAEVIRYVDPNQNGQYILLKKMCRSKKNIFKVVSKNLSRTLDGLKMPSKDVVTTLIWEKQSTLNPHDVMEELKANENLSEHMRYVFILDDDAPSFSERNPFYSEQLRLGLPVNILRNGTWCTYRRFHLPGANPELLPDIVDISKIKREDIDIHYISLNTQKQRIKNYEQDVYVLEYSGVTKDQKKVMGLARYRPDISNMEINIDPKLIWEVPPGVSMEDAATIPLLCGMANYALIMCVTSYDVYSALVHNGSSLHGLTCIAVAFHAQLEVFTTVYSAEERNIVKRHFPQLEDSHIIDAWAEQFDLRLKLLTGGRGADLVVSDVPASRITAAWECVAPHGSFIDLNETNMTVNAPLPMFHFLKCTTYYSCLKTGLFSLADWRKQELWNLVQATLTAGVLVKVPRRVFGAHQLDVAARVLNKEKGQQKILLSMKIPPRNPTKNVSMNKSIYHCNSTDAYFILSPSIGKSLSLIEWILIRGGRKVVLVVSNQIGGTKKLNDLINKYGAQLLISSIKKFNSGAETASLMDQIKKLRPVPILFNIYMDERLASHIASFLPNLHHIVNVARTQDSIQNKSGKGANTQKSTTRVCIICEDGESYLQLLDQALLSNSDPKNDSIYSINDGNKNLKKQTVPVREYLPKSFEELEEIGEYAESFPKPPTTATNDSTVESTDAVTDDPSDSNKNLPPDTENKPIDLPPCAAFEEVPTLARRQKYQREILPVYLISSSVKKFAPIQKKLLYPLYFAKFSEQMSSTAEAAKHLYNSICTIQPKGPCTIMTETWNTPIAIDLIGKLKESHRQASLTILPISQKSLLSVVPLEEEVEDIILRNLLQSSSKEYQSLYSEMALETKVAEIIGKVSPKSDKNSALAGLTIFKKQMQFFLETPLQNKLLDCPVLVVEMEANLVSQTDYAKISKGEVSVFRSPSTTYEELLADPTLIKELNSRQLFSWLHENEIVSK